MAIIVKREEYAPFGEVNVGYIAVNGREACIVFDPNSNPMKPFENLADLEAYLQQVEVELATMPPVEATEPPIDTTVREWRRDLFWRRFTPTERVAMITAAQTDPILEDFRMTMMMSPIIVSNDAELVAGMSYIVTKGIISEERKTEILIGE